MPQKLSAMKYIKNNKRRVSVLIVSLTLCFLLFYLSAFLLSATSETFDVLLTKNTGKVQYISLPSYTFGMNGETLEELGEDGYIAVRDEKNRELAEKLKKEKGVTDAYWADVKYVELAAVVGEYSSECPMLPPEEIPKFIEHFDAVLTAGRLPVNDGEICLDEKYMKNNGYELGDSLTNYGDTEIVGIVECEYYFACGAAADDKTMSSYNPQIVAVTDGSIEDMSSVIRSMGYEFDDADAHIWDISRGKVDLQENVIDSIDNSCRVIYIGITGIMSLAILIVYITYLRDRRNEYCLYCSIGFTRKCIYYAIMRELLFTFATSVLLGGLITAASMIILKNTIIDTLGLICRYYHGDVLLQILCVYVMIIALLQIPIRIALYKIRTIDAIDDDLL